MWEALRSPGFARPEGFPRTGLPAQGGVLLCLLIPQTIHHPFLGISPSLMPMGKEPKELTKSRDFNLCGCNPQTPRQARHPASALTRSARSHSQIQMEFASPISSCLPCPCYQQIFWQKHTQVSLPCSLQAWSKTRGLATSRRRARKEPQSCQRAGWAALPCPG